MTTNFRVKRKFSILLFLFFGYSIVSISQPKIELELLSTFHTGLFDQSAAEISSYDANTKRLFVTNAATSSIDIYDISDPNFIQLHASIDLAPYGSGANSVAVKYGIVATAVENNNKQLPGKAVFFDTNGIFINQITTGALPDMVTFSPNGRYVLLANEGEPNDDYTVDPEGSITLINIKKGIENITQSDVTQIDFKHFNSAALDESIRVNANPGNATVAQDLEPEYISVSKNSKYAWVTLQENNALALIDIRRGKVIDLVGLGFKDHSLPGNGIDASNESTGIQMANWPVKGMYMPDAITNYNRGWREYIVLANEGDSRDYSGYSEETRVEDLQLDPSIFPNAVALQDPSVLGRLKTTTATGDADGDGLFEEIYAYGARSFSIRKANGRLIYDSGDELESMTAHALPNNFNSTNDENFSFMDRSDDKGPEPEAVEVAKIRRRHYAFIGLERVGGIAIYDITNPYHPRFVEYTNNRNFTADIESEEAGDLGPEDILFIGRRDSPNRNDMIVVANEVSGSISIFNVNRVHNRHSHKARKIELEDEGLIEEEISDKLILAFNIYPNPIENGRIHFEENMDVTIYSMSGMKFISAENVSSLDVSMLQNGLYIIQNQDGETSRIYIK